MPKQVLVIFSTKDIEAAKAIQNGLAVRKISSFMSFDPEKGIKAGEEWRKRLEEELGYARVFMPPPSAGALATLA